MFKKTVLDNNLRILTIPMKGTKTASVLLLVGAGSKYEVREINGLSHFLEHMFFKGTKKRPNTLKLIEPLDKIGGQYNAFTSQEYTGYWAKVNADHLETALDWVSDIYLNSKIEQEEIDREKGTILQELKMYLDMPSQHISDIWTELLYGDQPAGWKIIGTEENIKSFQRDQFLDYLKTHYSANNTVVAVAGQINQPKVIEQLKGYFKNINTAENQGKVKVQEKQAKPQSLINFKETDQTHLHLGVRAYDIFHPDRYALGLLSVILGGNMSSRLFISVRERQGLAYHISSAIDADTDAGSLFARAGVDNSKVDKAIQTILKEFQKISREKVSSAELKKAKEYIKGSTLIEMESSDSQASFVASQELLTEKILTIEEKFAKIDKVTVNDIQRVARDIFKPEKLNLALIGPFKDKQRFEKILNL